MNIISAYLGVTLPYLLITILLMLRFRGKFRDICFNENSWAREECEDIKTEITLSVILSLIPIINLFVVPFWFVRYINEYKDDPILKFLRNSITNLWVIIKNKISYIILGK